MPNHAPFIYIIGPLHDKEPETVAINIERADQAAFGIQCAAHELGMPVVTFCPHSETGEYLLDCRNDEVKDNEHLYMRGYLSLLMSGKVDAVYFIGSSPGADVELMVAEEMGIKVLRDMEAVKPFLLDWRDKQCG
jgi:hypothetical protein